MLTLGLLPREGWVLGASLSVGCQSVLCGVWLLGSGWVVAPGWVLSRPVVGALVASGVAVVLCLEPHAILLQVDR